MLFLTCILFGRRKREGEDVLSTFLVLVVEGW